MTMTDPTTAAAPTLGDVVYRFEGQLGGLNPLGLFDDGIRFHNEFEGQVIEGPFAGGRIYGLDQFLLRPDGVGVIVAPEVIELGDVRVSLDLRGYVVPPAGAPALPLEALLEPGFAFPDVPLRVTGAATAATASPAHADLNGVVVLVEGTVNMATGRLDVTARRVEAPTA